jgi:hypothetical protein
MNAKAENRDPLNVDCERCGAKAGHACMFGRSERHQRFHLPRMKAAGVEPAKRNRRRRSRDKSQPRTSTQVLAMLDQAIKRGDLERVAKLERQLDRLLLGDDAPATVPQEWTAAEQALIDDAMSKQVLPPPSSRRKRAKSPRHPGFGIDESRLHEYDLELDASLDVRLEDEAA